MKISVSYLFEIVGLSALGFCIEKRQRMIVANPKHNDSQQVE